MYIAITKDYAKNRITLRYGLNKQTLVNKKFIKEVPGGLTEFDLKADMFKRSYLEELLKTFAKYSEIKFKNPNLLNIKTWIIKNAKVIDLYGFDKDEYLSQHISKNLAGKNCEVVAYGKAKS